MPLRIYIDGFYGAVNVGDEAVCESVVRGLSSVRPDAEFFVSTRDVPHSRSFCTIQPTWIHSHYPMPAHWRGFARWFNAVRRSDLVLIGGGGLLQDLHGWTFVGGFMLTASVAMMLGKPVGCIAIGAGPIQRVWLNRWLGRLCRDMFLLVVRDETSRGFLLQSGVEPDRIFVATDPVVGWLADSRSDEPAPEGQDLGLAIRPWKGLDEQRTAALIERMAERGNVRFFPFEPIADLAMADRLRDRLSAGDWTLYE